MEISAKEFTLMGLGLITSEVAPPGRLALVTAFGIIEGVLDDAWLEVFRKQRAKIKDKMNGVDISEIKTGDVISLKEVTITCTGDPSNKIKMDSIIVFQDQVIAAYVLHGRPNSKEE